MAFPVRISTQNRADVGLQMGPWALGGALYVFVLNASPIKICVSKSIDGGVTWTFPDIANSPAALTNPRYSVTQFGTTIRIIYGDNLGGGGGQNTGTMHAIDFDTATDTYGAVSDSGIGWDAPGIADPAPSIVALTLSTLTTRVIYVNHTTLFTSQLRYVDYDGAVWGTPADITAITASTLVQPATAVVDSSDMIHLAYVFESPVGPNQSLRYASITLGGSVNAGQLILTPFEGFTGTLSISGSNLVLPVVDQITTTLKAWLGSSFAGGAPTWTSVSPDTNTYSADAGYTYLPCTLAYDSTTLFLVWSVFDFFSPFANTQVWYGTSTDDGATWSAPILAYDLALNPPGWTSAGAIDELSFNRINGTILLTGNIHNAGTATLAEIAPSATVSCGNPPTGTVGRPYAHTFPATGAEPFFFTIIGLPDGLALNSATGEITGIPTAKGTSLLTVQVTDANDEEGETECAITIRSRCLLGGA